MKSTTLATTILAPVLLAAAAQATPIVQTKTFSFTPNGEVSLVFDKFNGPLANVTGITVEYTLTKTGGTFTVDNDSATSGTITVYQQLVGSLSSDNVSLLNNSLRTPASLTARSELVNQFIGETSGDSTIAFDLTGKSDNVKLAPAPLTVASAQHSISSLVYNDYVGSGTYVVKFAATQSQDATGIGGLQGSFTKADVSGFVTITYQVPEPATLALFGLAIPALLRRRRA